MKVSPASARAATSGLVAAGAGFGVSELLSGFLHARLSPLTAVGQTVIQLAPGRAAESAVEHLGHADKPFVIAMVLLVLAVVSAGAGLLARWSLLAAEVVFAAVGVVSVLASRARLHGSDAAYVPAVGGTLVAMVLLGVLADRAAQASLAVDRDPPLPASIQLASRRAFLRVTGLVVVAAGAAGIFGRLLAESRARVDDARAALARRFRGVPAAAGVDVGVPGVSPWKTPIGDFYRVDTALSVPLVVPSDWRLRVHGMVRRELTLTYDELLARGLVRDWTTLCCVSNPVGGGLVGNAYWEGVPIAALLADAGVKRGADAVLSTSADGWTAGTPLAALTDGRNALLAVAMNGVPLTPEHGFPVRMVVPGLYGYVSATKWVTDLEVTRFSDFRAFWTERGWSPRGPVKTQSRIDVPLSGATLSAGRVMVAGVAWAQHRGIKRVELQVDAGPWLECRLAADPSIDCWRQWAYAWDAEPGAHTLSVRATDDSGAVQTSRVQGVVPNGASGYHRIQLTVS